MAYTPEQIERLKATDPAILRQALERMTPDDRSELMMAIQGEAPKTADLDRWQKDLKTFKLANDLETVQRPGDGALWLDQTKGFSGGDPGWYIWEDGKWAKKPSRPEYSLWEQAKATALHGATKSLSGLAEIGMTSMVGPDNQLTISAPGMGQSPMTMKMDAAGAAEMQKPSAPARFRQETQQQFQDVTGGGLVPSIAAELMDPANLLGAEVGALAASKIAGRTVPKMLARGAVRGGVGSVPAAVLRPGATPGSAATEIALGTGTGAVLEPAIEYGKQLIGKRLQARNAAPESVPVPAQAAEPSIAAASEPVVPTPTQQTEAVEVAREAIRRGAAGEDARAALAGMANIDRPAMQAVESLGVDLPVDVYSRNPQVKALAGLSRSIPGSEAQAAWIEATSKAVNRADELMSSLGTVTEQGAVSPGSASMRVRQELLGLRDELEKQAQPLFDQIEDSIGRPSPIEPNATQNLMNTLVDDVGGIPANLSATEREVLRFLEPGVMTYGSLHRLRERIGQAIGSPKKFNDASDRVLKQIYGALAEDQRGAALAYGGEELASTLDQANSIYARKMGIQDRIVQAFGPEAGGSIADMMQRAMTEGTKGGNKSFFKLKAILDDVPEDMKRETIATAISSLTTAKSGAGRGKFGMAEFSKLYPQLRANPEVYSEIVKSLGPNADELMRSLFTMSKSVYESSGYQERTGRALSGMMQQLLAKSKASQAIGSGAGRAVATGVVGAVAPGGPITTMATAGGLNILADMLDTAGTKTGDKLAKMLGSEEFRALALKASAEPDAFKSAANRLAYSKTYQDWAKTVKGAPRDPRAVVNWFRQGATAGYETKKDEE
jgi:hypothetical protein